MNSEIVTVPDQIAVALHRKAALAGQDLITFLQEVANDDSLAEAAPPQRRINHEEFRTLLKEIAELSPGSRGEMDDSRESIYVGCGE